jgi:hypothetical protein
LRLSSPNLPLLHAHVAPLAKLPPSSQPPVTTSALQCHHLFAHALEPSHHLLMLCSNESALLLLYCHCSAAAVVVLDEIPRQELGNEASHSPFRWLS